MANNRFVFTGLDELKAELRALPATLTSEASHDVSAAAEGAANAIAAIYGQHAVTHHLQDSVTVTQQAASSYGVAMVVKVNDPIAWIFDNGTEVRHWSNGKLTGRMPATHVFVRTMIEARRRMYVELQAMLERHGLVVSGKP